MRTYCTYGTVIYRSNEIDNRAQANVRCSALKVSAKLVASYVEITNHPARNSFPTCGEAFLFDTKLYHRWRIPFVAWKQLEQALIVIFWCQLESFAAVRCSDQILNSRFSILFLFLGGVINFNFYYEILSWTTKQFVDSYFRSSLLSEISYLVVQTLYIQTSWKLPSLLFYCLHYMMQL